MIQSKIQELAESKGFKTPEALSKITNLTRSTIYNVWSGDVAKRQLETMIIVAGALNVPIDHLFEITED